jgi:hypothetical protein
MPTFDFATAQDFMRFVGAPRVLVAIVPDGPIIAATPTSLASFKRFLTAHADTAGLYFTVNRTHRPMTAKPRKADIKWCDFAHVDLDPTDDVATSDLDAWQRRAREKVCRCAYPPSIMWRSGNGLQCLWKLAKPALLDSPGAIERCEAANLGLMELFVDHECKREGTWNIDRVLRIPGSINHPNRVKKAIGRVTVGAGDVESL